MSKKDAKKLPAKSTKRNKRSITLEIHPEWYEAFFEKAKSVKADLATWMIQMAEKHLDPQVRVELPVRRGRGRPRKDGADLLSKGKLRMREIVSDLGVPARKSPSK